MNKNFPLFIVALVAVFTLTSCAKETRTTVVTTDAQNVETTVEANTLNINTQSSLITWNGYKSLVNTEHEGTIQLSSGQFFIDDENQLVGGEFTIDMTTLDNTDLSGSMKDGLLGHLNSAEFFDTQNYTTASFQITKVLPIQENGATHQISGNLTIKDISKNITFKADVQGLDSGNISVSADFNINRQNWSLGHSEDASVLDQVKDNAIKNEVRIRLDIQS